MIRPIQVDHTKFLQVDIKTHSFCLYDMDVAVLTVFTGTKLTNPILSEKEKS